MQIKIQTSAREGMDKAQKEYYLREQLKAIRKELGDGPDADEELEDITKAIEKAGLPADVRKEADKQLKRLATMHGDSAEASVVRTYLDWLAELPWKKMSKDQLDIVKAKDVLDEDHYGLTKIKDRILEYLSVRKLNPDSKGPILCFAGPPGVGKTSLGRSIARALGRKFQRISLGGMRDEAEIRGHRRTYIGAMPGRIIQAMKQAGTRNPVIILDEIDKLGQRLPGRSVFGSPGSAGSGTELQLQRSLPERTVRSLQGAVHLHGEPSGEHPRPAPRPSGDHFPARLYAAGKAGHCPQVHPSQGNARKRVEGPRTDLARCGDEPHHPRVHP